MAETRLKRYNVAKLLRGYKVEAGQVKRIFERLSEVVDGERDAFIKTLSRPEGMTEQEASSSLSPG